jgi:hypothetical protein
VKLTQVGNILKIILRENDVDAARPPLELQEEITKLCGITEPFHIAILHWILVEHDLKEIEDVLQRRGIPDDLPEFDNMTRNAADGENVIFSGLDAENLEQRRYHGRKPKHQPKPSDARESVDAVQSFINKFNLANSFQSKITQSWQDAEAKNMLSHICRLENMDPFILLPQRNDCWTQRIRKAGGYPDDHVGVVFDEKVASDKKDHLSRSAQIFPAIVNVAGNGHIRVGVSTAENIMIDDEILFVGELYVRI